ncbi:MAG: L-rhamnose/proton symporter RhaT [Terriglobia bacterium]
MAQSFWLGMGTILLSGVAYGVFAIPLKYSRRWRWENTWLLYALLSMVILPWMLAIGFVPQLRALCSGTPSRLLLLPLGFGFILGFAQVAYGIGIVSVGISIAVSVVSGVSCVTGALVPLLVLQPSDLLRTKGILLLVSLPILLAGVVLYGMAGYRREKEQEGLASEAHVYPWGFGTGLAICIFTGVFGSSINLGFAFSGEIIRKSLALGGSSTTSTFVVWTLVFGAGFIPNLVYCSYLLFRNRGWSRFLAKGWPREATFATVMAVLSLGAFIGYGRGATVMGRYGTSVGWALFVAATVVASNVAGLIMGEWRDTSQHTRRLLIAAVFVLLATVGILNLGGIL